MRHRSECDRIVAIAISTGAPGNTIAGALGGASGGIVLSALLPLLQGAAGLSLGEKKTGHDATPRRQQRLRRFLVSIALLQLAMAFWCLPRTWR